MDRPRLPPPARPGGSWLSVEDATDFDRPSTDFDRGWLEDGRVFEQGVPNLLSAVALCESLGLLTEVGVVAIESHIRVLRRRMLEGLGELPRWRPEAQRLQGLEADRRLASVVALHHGEDDPGQGEASHRRRLATGAARGIHASVREGCLRIAFHGWHRTEDVDRLLDWLADD